MDLKANFTEDVKICATAGYLWRSKLTLTTQFATTGNNFIEVLISWIASTVTGDKYTRRCENNLYPDPELARNIMTNLIPNQARPEKPGPNYNSALTYVYRDYDNAFAFA